MRSEEEAKNCTTNGVPNENIIRELRSELELYKKAYNLLSKAYCDKGECWSVCECYEQCKTIGKKGVDVTKEFFMQKARAENDR